MAFTRFHDDPARIRKQLEESTFIGQYQLNRPGPGIALPFWEDPHIRLQHWAANLHTNTLELESELKGLKRPLSRDLVNLQQTPTYINSYPSLQPFVEESRASHPAWMYRDVEQAKWETPFLDPQGHLEKKFPHNIQTRILEKDRFVPTV